MRDMTGGVVVGFDGSEHAAAAVDWAAAEAARRRTGLTVLFAIDYAGMLAAAAGPVAWLPPDTDTAAQRMAEQGAARARERAPGVPVTAVTDTGGAASALLEASRSASLVVVGTRGHGTVTGLLLGSVAFAVTAHSHCPVVVVRGDSSRPVGPDRPLVVGVDGSEGGQVALDLAAEHAAQVGAELRLVTAWLVEAAESWASGYWIEHYPGQDPTQVARRAAETLLAQARDRVARQHPELEVSTTASQGVPVKVLAEASRGAGLVVVGARGRGDLARLLMGSVSRGVVHTAQCPVEVVRFKQAGG